MIILGGSPTIECWGLWLLKSHSSFPSSTQCQVYGSGCNSPTHPRLVPLSLRMADLSFRGRIATSTRGVGRSRTQCNFSKRLADTSSKEPPLAPPRSKADGASSGSRTQGAIRLRDVQECQRTLTSHWPSHPQAESFSFHDASSSLNKTEKCGIRVVERKTSHSVADECL